MKFPDLSIILVAGGGSTRFGSGNKLLCPLNGRPVFLHSAELFARLIDPEKLVIVVPARERELFQRTAKDFGFSAPVRWADGGAFRCKSVQSGLRMLGNAEGFVAIHDAARPLVTETLVEKLLISARIHGGAIPGKPVTDTLKTVDPATGLLTGTIPRAGAFAVETPQIFQLDKLREAYRQFPDSDYTDDASIFQAAHYPCAIVNNSEPNRKITYRFDLKELQTP